MSPARLPVSLLAPIRTFLGWGTMTVLATAALAATGIPILDKNPNLAISADLRVRYESDWDSHTSTGVLRTDRERGRLRARLGGTYKLSDTWSVGTRLRTGNHQSQQSPHLTFTANDGPSDDLEGSFDRYYLQYKSGPVNAWGGRNTTPFWQQTEAFWDEDVTPTGVAATFDSKQGAGTLTSTVAAFALPDGATRLHGRLLGGQLKYTIPLKPDQFTVAAGLHSFDGDTGARFLRNRNGERNYLVGVLSAQYTMPVEGHLLAFGVDVMKNFENYSAADVAPFPDSAVDDTTGLVLSAQYGQLKQAKDWMIGYYYSYIETLAVNASYSQDDWARFGNGAQSDLTDFEGHEFRAAYALTKNVNVMARLFFVEAISTQQDGKRFRLDLNWKL